MANFGTVDAAKPRLVGEFSIEAIQPYAPTADESAFVARIADLMDTLALDEAQDGTTDPATVTATALARSRLRRDTVARLRLISDEFARGDLAPLDARDQAMSAMGAYDQEKRRLSMSLFVVEEEMNGHLCAGVILTVADHLPPPDNMPSQDKQALYVELDRVHTTVKAVCERMGDGQRSARLRDEYMRKVAGLARVGLQGSLTNFATLGLEGLRNEFTSLEAGRIKNTYVHKLGIAAGLVAIVLFGIAALIEVEMVPTSAFWMRFQPFFIAAGGAAIGTWLSFSIRRVTLTFNDLAILEEDLLEPGIRIVFVIGLTMIACLLFWTNAMNIEIGNLKTAEFGGPTALLVGTFMGISERALATAISGRAAAFVRGIGSS